MAEKIKEEEEKNEKRKEKKKSETSKGERKIKPTGMISRSRYSSDWARRVTSLFARPSALASAWAASSAGPF
jgi:reverse gyrase